MKTPTQKAQPKAKPIIMGGIEAKPGADVPLRMALLLWGEYGCGKTTFAATAPGKKLFIQLDPDGTASIAHRNDFLCLDLSGLATADLMRIIKGKNPLGLDDTLHDHEEIETVIVDSCTALFARCLEEAIAGKYGESKKSGFVPTLEAPGMTAYGARTNILVSIMQNIMRITAKYGVHVIFMAHEGNPEKDNEGVVMAIKSSLSDTAMNNTAWMLSDIWYMSDTRGRHKIAVRPTRLRSPMKTRMFDTSHGVEFILLFDPDKPDSENQHTLAKWLSQWEKSGGKRLPLPKDES